MATVVNKGTYTPVDKKYATPNRTNAGTPVSSLTPLYTNELVLDTTNNVYYRANGTTNTSWLPVVKNESF